MAGIFHPHGIDMDKRKKSKRYAALAATTGACLACSSVLVAGSESPVLPLPSPIAAPDPIEECQAGEAFVMPATGFAFTLPPLDTAAAAQPCEPPEPPMPIRPAAPSLFRMVALPVGSAAAPMGKWEAARMIAIGEQAGPWNELLAQGDRIGADNPLGTVNRWVNWRVRYVDDKRGDEWSAAAATLARGYGDCEDFALAKMALLQELGIPSDDMFLVLLRDRAQDEHAVLAVRLHGRFHVLDNRTDKVLPAERIEDYTPIMSYSGAFVWTYGKPAG
ncbi:transglutaminase-like cysteine peptidase [Qipengyuania gaetbuli]|uniref:transglutaminase-like cysteine peptidase n=1 Tax=Qipengyuania gaetbuli TaxID=266952 RepID=UPI001CFD5DE3|nr:transglutaminase-like cysteine peptidase [Qipengyuania gaetbuli]